MLSAIPRCLIGDIRVGQLQLVECNTSSFDL